MKVKKLTIKSKHPELEHVYSFLDKLGKRQKWPPSVHEKILLAGSEAATNAMDHGNNYDPTKQVHIEVTQNEVDIVITVEDEGEGFTREDVPDPMASENLMRDSGRGLFIIEQIADEVTYQKSGRRIVLRFNRLTEESETSAA